jgi:hypothetical protein
MDGAHLFSHMVTTMAAVAAVQMWIVMGNQCLVTVHAVQQIVPLDFAHNLDHVATESKVENNKVITILLHSQFSSAGS